MRDSLFSLVSFEGTDPYSQAGGLGVRVSGLARTLAELRYETHLFFIGDPALPGEEKQVAGRLVLHRYGHDPETIDAPVTGAGYAHELAEVTGRVAAGHTESELMPLADTVAVQDIMGQIAAQLGMRVTEGAAELP